ncbi:MAG TPA: hypothetical protein V6C58_20355 [Allocoleopsis sp.]
MTNYKSVKIERNKYSAPRPKRRFSINVSDKFCVVNHKGRWIVALTHNEGWKSYFYGNQTINRTQALKMIGFLSDYVNMVKPTEATFLNATIKASANRIVKNTNELTGKAIK